MTREEKKLKIEQIAEMYNKQLLPFEIAQRTDLNVRTVYNYISYIRRNNLVNNEIKTIYERTIDLFKKGESKEQIAEKLGIRKKTVDVYIANARKEGTLGKVEKGKPRIEQLVELYKAGKSIEEIAKEMGIEEISVKVYIVKARHEGLLEKIKKGKTRTEQTAELCKAGKSIEEIAEEMKIKEATVISYIQRAQGRGLLEKNKKGETRIIEQVAELYKEGKNTEEIAKKMEIEEDAVKSYIVKAKRRGLLGISKLKTEVAVELFYDGKSVEEIAKTMGIQVTTAIHYIRKARKIGLIERKKSVIEQSAELYRAGKSKEEIEKEMGITRGTLSNYLNIARKKDILDKEIEEDEQEIETHKRILEIKMNNLKKKILDMYEREIYILDIAKNLNIKEKIVYDVIEHMPEEEAKRVRAKKIKLSPLYDTIKETMNNKKMTALEAINDLEFTMDIPNKRIELAKLNYIIGRPKTAKNILIDMVEDEELSEKSRVNAEMERRKIELETRASGIRKEMKDAKKEGKNISYDYLCKKYRVRMIFVENIIGEEQREI